MDIKELNLILNFLPKIPILTQFIEEILTLVGVLSDDGRDDRDGVHVHVGARLDGDGGSACETERP